MGFLSLEKVGKSKEAGACGGAATFIPSRLPSLGTIPSSAASHLCDPVLSGDSYEEEEIADGAE